MSMIQQGAYRQESTHSDDKSNRMTLWLVHVPDELFVVILETFFRLLLNLVELFRNHLISIL